MQQVTTEWILDLVAKLNPEKIMVDTEAVIVGYVWNKKKKELHFIGKKTANKLTRKNILWKKLGEDW